MSQHHYEPQPPVPYQTYVPVHVAPKSTIGALALSFFLPGVGSMYAGKPAWGVPILVLWLLSFPLLFVAVGAITLPACWIVGMILGYQQARDWNREHGIIS
jgi:TM2 domain-containing membrane protein YozV